MDLDPQTPVECVNPLCRWKGTAREAVFYADQLPRCRLCVSLVTVQADEPALVLDSGELADTA